MEQGVLVLHYYLFMFRSLTVAQRAARRLGPAGVRAAVIRAPYSLSADGCGYCIKISGVQSGHAFQVLEDTGLSPRKIFRAVGQDSYEEVVGFDLP